MNPTRQPEFSSRTSHHESPNALTLAVANAKAPLLDLTISNPTVAGLPYPAQSILDALADPRGLAYSPAPLGLRSAREAVAQDWGARGVRIDASQIALTASTSEAYSVLLKLLCDPGDEVLVPAPSYPLLGFLASFESVCLRSYSLVYAGGWHVDLDGLRAAITPRTKAIVVIGPNNPTGSYLSGDEFEAMLDTGLPIVSDEVFATYPLTPSERRLTSVANSKRGLVFALEGLSKLAALPQLKLGWIGVAGEARNVQRAMDRLELVLDTFLSVGAPIQHALPSILASREITHSAIRTRTRTNLDVLRRSIERVPTASVLNVEGGWYAIVRVPDTRSDEEWALALVARAGIHVQPGYFFDMGRGAHLVLSLLTPETAFAEGVARLATYVTNEG